MSASTRPEKAADELTPQILAYLATQTLGRLATVDSRNAPQNSPVGFAHNAELGTIDIGGWNLAESRKFRNVLHNPAVSLVVDDIASTDPWAVRMVEIRGTAEALTDVPGEDGTTRPLIRVHPRRIISFGLDGEAPPA
ncbi:PPOX class F420-dependent oxidoreductase [Kineosporia rhizophila]|uniref:PPOX class F420-dependent oxidoreductase n=1 Tax=Kineosporia TaxID=49184 RepID=UPI000AD61C57|nr:MULTISPECIES: PPOX class F420-dependent oxidoreductase [Kineosporia]MCE0540572.1 PPOX class F420-dependent oxidoreductase [Kineosporia rhizophila]GLY17293.1 PPOX class F420-dependent oxidoreductase [Kineosporia sp. NBRC 101677]